MTDPVKIALAAGALAFFAAMGMSAVTEGSTATGKAAAPSAKSVVAAPSAAPATTTLQADTRGHFVTHAQIEGSFIEVMVDTGASMVAMSAEDAQKAGIRPQPGARKGTAKTANGSVPFETARIRELRLNGIIVRDVEAAIMPPGALQGTLLGMSFLSKLSKVEMGKGRLTLVQ